MRAAGGDFDDDPPPEGIPVAMGVLRNGPIESDEEDERRDGKRRRNGNARLSRIASPEREPLNGKGRSRDDSLDGLGTPDAPQATASSRDGEPERGANDAVDPLLAEVEGDLRVPEVPRKSSKRNSWTRSQSREPHPKQSEQERNANLSPPAVAPSRLPFERTGSQKTGSSAGLTDDFVQVDLQDSNNGAPAGYGFVNQGSASRVDHQVDLLGSSAEVVDERR
ncbi:hypothetical protein VTH82DRAFT_2779 [Thermothelomyces myriococcoides]